MAMHYASIEFVALASLAVSLFALCLFLSARVISARRDAGAARRVIHNLTEGVYRSSLDGRMLSANPSLVRLNGYRTEAELVGAVNSIATEWYVDPARRDTFRQLLERDGRVVDFVSEIRRHKTRERIWITENARLIRDDRTGAPLYFEGTVREITETMQKRRIEERLNKLAANVPGGLFQLMRGPDGQFSVPYLSTSFFRVVGQPSAGIEVSDPMQFISLIHPDDLQTYLESLKESGVNGSEWRCEFRVSLPGNDQHRWLRVQATPERLSDRSLIWHGFISDISAEKDIQARIEQLAYYDHLSGLPNRRLLNDRIDQARAVTRRRDKHAGVLFIDLDDFKAINDRHGHEVGDDFIRLVGRRIVESVRESDTVARYGGDEFVVLLHDLDPDPAMAERNARIVAAKVVSGLKRGFELAGSHRCVTASIGATLFKGKSATTVDILNRADAAMYMAKRAGRARVVFDAAPLPAGEPSATRSATQSAA